MLHWIFSLDTSILEYLYAIRTIPVTIIFIDISEFGRWQIALGFAVLISLFCILYKRYADIFGIFAAFLGSGIAILALKYIIHRPRPDLHFQAYPEGPYFSFPSAHAGIAMALYGFFFYLLLQSSSTQLKRLVLGALPLLIFLIGFSRLYLGVHYLTDVLAGFAIGALFVYFGIFVRLQVLRVRETRRG
jgi:undecaprenyl-diphosphatase